MTLGAEVVDYDCRSDDRRTDASSMSHHHRAPRAPRSSREARGVYPPTGPRRDDAGPKGARRPVGAERREVRPRGRAKMEETQRRSDALPHDSAPPAVAPAVATFSSA